MIQVGTVLKVTDNSGARFVKCIKILAGSRQPFGFIGNKIVASVKGLRSKRRAQSKVAVGSIVYGIIIRQKFLKKNTSNILSNYKENAVALINNQGKPLGSRIFGGVTRELRYTKYMRLASLASGLLK